MNLKAEKWLKMLLDSLEELQINRKMAYLYFYIYVD